MKAEKILLTGKKTPGSFGAMLRLSSLCLALLMVLFMKLPVKAEESDKRMNRLNGGVGALLEPGRMDTAEVINATAKKLNISLEVNEEMDFSELVMANVQQELNVRSRAGNDAEIVGKLYKDCGGFVLERADGWTKIQSGNLIGWADDEFLAFDEEAETMAKDAGKTIATVNIETLRVREEASPKSKVLGFLPEGEIVDVLEEPEDSEWVRVDYNGQDGYVKAMYVDITFSIDTGETMEEQKARLAAEREAKRHVNYGAYTVDADTTLLLAALIHCEAGGEPYEGQVAVGAVVMNRVRSAAYPNTIHGVIYASGQFTPAMNGKVNRVYESGKIYASCIKAAEEALSGVSNVGDLTHFRRVNGREGLVIGNHVFY